MGLINDLTELLVSLGTTMSGIALSGYVGMITLVNSLRGSTNKADMDLVEAWDRWIVALQGRAKVKELYADSTELTNHQERFKKKWGKQFPNYVPLIAK